MLTPEPDVADEIRTFIRENWDAFARWDNGEADPGELDWIASRSCDDWVLINARMPGFTTNKDDFREFFPSLHGRFADDPVTPRVDFLVIGQLAPDAYVTTYLQHYDAASGTTASRLITAVLVRLDGSLRVQLVHE